VIGKAKAPRSLRSIATVNSADEKLDNSAERNASAIAGLKAALFSVSYAALGAMACATATHAIGQAFHMVRNGMVTAAVTGGHRYTLTLANHDDNYPGDPTYTLYDDVVIQ